MSEASPVVTIRSHPDTFSPLDHEASEPDGSQPDPGRRTPSADSGYVSQASQPGLHDRETANSSRKSLPRGVPVMLGGSEFFRYKKPPNEPCQPVAERFGEIIDHMQPLLVNCVKKHGTRVSLVSFRQMFLGKKNEEPHDYLVVLCPSNISSLVRDFLNKESAIRELCDPCDPQIPSFKVVVEGRPPRLVARTSGFAVFDNEISRDSFSLLPIVSACGRSVIIKSTGKSKAAICGGIIKVERSDASTQLYGMLAGHSVFSVDDLDSSDDLVAKPQEEDLQPYSKDAEVPANSTEHGIELGEVVVKGYGGIRDSVPDYDWALFELSSSKPVMFLNNLRWLMPDFVSSKVGRFPPHMSHQEVRMIGRHGRCSPGSLSNVPARIFLGMAEIATPVFTLTLREGDVCEGDSGSWVVSSSTHDVFGHVVAVDIFGDAYVVPLEFTFEDIRQKLQLQVGSVQLSHQKDFDQLLYEKRFTSFSAMDKVVLRTAQAMPAQLPQERLASSMNDGDADISSSTPSSIAGYAPSISSSTPSSVFSYAPSTSTSASSVAGSLDTWPYGSERRSGPGTHRRKQRRSPDIAREVIEEW